MQTKELIKKYWFIMVLAVLAVGFIVFYAVDSAQHAEKEISALTVDDKSLIYSINGENYYADDLYEELKPRYAFTSNFMALDRLVTDKAVETTSEMESLAASNAQYLLSMYDEDTLANDLRSMGFNGIDELDDYYLYVQKNVQLSKDYFMQHQSEYVDPYIAEKNPRLISHILISVADVEETENEDGTTTLTAHPTAEEEAKLNEVLSALENEEFADVAYEYSDDGSASNGGYLGLIDEDSKSTYVEEFADVAMSLEEGEVSDVVLSQYGYHIIKCDATTASNLLNSQDFLSALYSRQSNLYAKVIVEKAEELGIVIDDEEFQNEINENLNESEDAQ